MNYEEFYSKSIQSPEEFWKEQADQIEWYNSIGTDTSWNYKLVTAIGV